ncbi:hypothetical protein [Allobaculum sp. JKK-2023]|uniref:hypothetical protein n=1 Tax=Allobaculum sp. JKK-2023 TaxID=3108943 RepID=UPI002B06107E|nr:hypothetical protein [Allobaculum sp. JKK-2023]
MSIFRHLTFVPDLTQTFLFVPSSFLSNHNSLLILTYGLNFLRFCRLASKVFVSDLQVASLWKIKKRGLDFWRSLPAISGFQGFFQRTGEDFFRADFFEKSLFAADNHFGLFFHLFHLNEWAISIRKRSQKAHESLYSKMIHGL